MNAAASPVLADEAGVKKLVDEAVVWDSQGCLPLRPGELRFLPQLIRYRDAGVKIVAINVGFDAMPWHQTFEMLAHLRQWIRRAGAPCEEVGTVTDLQRVASSNPRRLGIFFNIEGGCALNERLSMVELYRDLGVRSMLIAYNRSNALGGGCQDEDHGLTPFGKAVVTEMERVGMMVCCSHTGFRTTMDVMQHAARPVIFSHSNAFGMWPHKRNIRDEAIKACAATGGVVGINGIKVFLGRSNNMVQMLVEHIDYVAQLVGVDHVGLGLNYAFDFKEVEEMVKANPQTFPREEGYGAEDHFCLAPEQVPAIAAELLERGYGVADAHKVLGGNFMRVARQMWPK